MKDVVFASANQLGRAIQERQCSSREVVEAFLAQIARFNPLLKAVVTLDEAGALRAAQAADAALARGELWGPLHGVPITLEDAHATRGLRSTWGGHPSLADYLPKQDGTVAARLKAAGAILLGKTNGPVIWGEQSIFEPTRNPWDPERSPGGSSAGPAAALAAGLSALDIGMDTLGSILNPAQYCGIFGMRPSEHRVPLTGAFFIDGDKRKFRVLSVAGPMARDLEDLRLALSLIAGPDHQDTQAPPLPWREAIPPAVRDLQVAWTATFPDMPVASVIRTAIETLANQLEQLGARVEHCLPDINFTEQRCLGWQLFETLASALDPRPEGKPAPSIDDYLQLLDQRDRCITAWERFFTGWDIFLCPAGPITAERISDKELVVDGITLSEEQMARLDIPYAISPVGGLPAIVMPLGQDPDGLPYGVQLLGRRWEDEKLLAAAETILEIGGGFQRPAGY